MLKYYELRVKKRHMKNYAWEIGDCSTEMIIFKQVKSRDMTEKYSRWRRTTSEKAQRHEVMWPV